MRWLSLFIFSWWIISSALFATSEGARKRQGVFGAERSELRSLWQRDYGDLPVTGLGKLTRFAAQEAVGLPEARAFMQDLEEAGFEFREPRIALFEEQGALHPSFLMARVDPQLITAMRAELSEYDKYLREHTEDWDTEVYAKVAGAYHLRKTGNEHALAVANLLTGTEPVGASVKGVIAAEVERRSEEAARSERMWLQWLPRKDVDIVNYAVYFHGMHALEALMKLVADSSALQVMCAGNDFPFTLCQTIGQEERLQNNMIVVSSCSPLGCTSRFSRAGRYITISAPSDHYIQTITRDFGRFSSFSGTSGAAPLVSGALADVLSILPKLTTAEAQHMLRMTAIEANIDTEVDGAGVLNVYKLLRVAERIKRKSGGSIDKIKRLIYENASYNFRDEATRKKIIAKSNLHSPKSFRLLREAFFLNSKDMQTRSFLASIYRRHGYNAQALYYDDPEKSRDNQLVKKELKYRKMLAEIDNLYVFVVEDAHQNVARYVDFAVENPDSPIVLETLLNRLFPPQEEEEWQGDLMEALKLNPALLVKEKPNLFAIIKKHKKLMRK